MLLHPIRAYKRVNTTHILMKSKARKRAEKKGNVKDAIFQLRQTLRWLAGACDSMKNFQNND